MFVTEYIQQTILKSSLDQKNSNSFAQIGNGGPTILHYEDTQTIQVLGNKYNHGIPFPTGHLTTSHCIFIVIFIITINRKCL